MNSEEREAQAKQRFMLLNLTRFLSVALVMLGVTIISGRLLQGMEFVGYIFVVLGAAEFFLMPVILKKAWNKQDGKPS
jgi:Na+/melibiose symporter-like transporter